MRNTPRRLVPLAAILCTALTLAGMQHAAAQDVAGLDTVTAGRFDMGRMWTFEYPPTEYFRRTYGFDADSAWFATARLAALRIPGCSASFVSASGLVVTNHHCIRGRVVQVQREGEQLLDNGFFAHTPGEERPIEGMWADQLIAVHDVSDEVNAVADAPVAQQNAAMEAIVSRLQAQHGDSTLRVEIIPLYNGGLHSAYVFRRYTDLRLVAAAELQVGFFGGDPDNFTYPRHALDFGLMRVYGADGRPLSTPHFFEWSQDGIEEGDVVFVIGNPGPTTRLTTMSQLEFLRDVGVPATLHFFETRLAALQAFYREDPATGEALDLRNRMFSLSNTLKASTGRLQALHDPYVMRKRAENERILRDSLRAHPELATQYEPLFSSIESLQQQKRGLGGPHQAFVLITNPSFASATIRRALFAQMLSDAQARNAPADTIAAMSAQLRRIGDHPAGIERRFLELRLEDFRRFLGPDHPVTRAALAGLNPEQAADALMRSVLGDSARAAAALDAGALPASDPAVTLGAALLPAVVAYQQEWSQLGRQEAQLAAQFGNARLAVYGTSVPPDASSSPRITDGLVLRYEYNGTFAPPFTTFHGMYDRYHAHGPDGDWALPDRWVPAPAGLDLATPLNFISTADTYGGNSGSPAVTPDLKIVGLNFDRNIEGLVRDYIFLPERGRNVMVDLRAVRAALEHVYEMDRIVAEIDAGAMP
ncbi:MAG TPA: S46 family peptidase [Longimicrobiales bacterium]|nr:S46 family peptidase [Longimicrobiales bacterium]